MSIASVLGKIRGPYVEIAGFLVIAVMVFLAPTEATAVATFALLMFYVLTRLVRRAVLKGEPLGKEPAMSTL